MNQSEFLASMQTMLTGTSYDRRALAEFVASCWPMIQDDPDVLRWSREFAAGVGACVLA